MNSSSPTTPDSQTLAPNTTLFRVLEALSREGLAPFLFALVVGVPSAFLYAAETCIVAANRKRRFDSAFYKLFMLRAIIALGGYVSSYMRGDRFARIGYFFAFYERTAASSPAFALMIRVGIFARFYAPQAENFVTTAILLNRLTSVLTPIKHTQLWRHRLLPLSYATALLLPAAFLWPIFTFGEPFFYKAAVNDGSYMVTFRFENFTARASWQFSLFMAVLSTCTIVMCVALNAATVVVLRHRRHVKTAAMAAASGNAMLERRLNTYAFFTFLGQSMLCVLYILLFISGFNSNDARDTVWNRVYVYVLANHYSWVHDLGTLAIPAWLLLWASTDVREAVIERVPLIRCRCRRGGRRVTPIDADALPRSGADILTNVSSLAPERRVV